MLTPEELAEKLNISKRTIYTWVSEGRLPAYKMGKKLRFKESEIDDWVLEQRA